MPTEDLVQERQLELAVALAAELGAEVGGPQTAVLDLLLQRTDHGHGRLVALVVRIAEHQVERLDVLTDELVHPVELELVVGVGAEVPCHAATLTHVR